MATADGAAVQFAIDGQGFGGPATFSFDRLAGLVCTADADDVARLLPSPLLHPVRWFTGRAGAAAGRSARAAGRRCGRPPVPRGHVRDRRRHCQRVAAEILRLNFGPAPTVCAIREDRGRDRLRFTAADAANGDILSLDVPVGGRSTRVDGPSRDYFVTGQHLQRSTQHQAGSQSVRLGRSTARLHLGQHPLAERLRGVGLSTRPLMTIVQRDVTVTVDRPPERLAPAQASPAGPTAVDPLAASMVIVHEDGHEQEEDQLPDGLPFDPAGLFDSLRTA